MIGEIKQAEKCQFSQQYLDDIKNVPFKRMDSKEYGGNGDGKISIGEALRDLHVDFLRNDGFFQNKQCEKKFDNAVAKLPDVLANYAGDDKEFSAQEWAEFINSKEWNDVLSSRPFNFPWNIGKY